MTPGSGKRLPKRREQACSTRRVACLSAAASMPSRSPNRTQGGRIGAHRLRPLQVQGGHPAGTVEGSAFGPLYRVALERLAGEKDAARLIELTAVVARSIYEGESTELGLLRGASAFSPALRRTEQEFETMRFDMQEERVRLLFTQRKARKDLSFEEARRILWMYSSRVIYRMLVQESGWTPDRYQAWLSKTLVATLVEPA